MLAQQLVNELILTHVNPSLRPAMYDNVDSSVDTSSESYTNQLANASRTAVR